MYGMMLTAAGIVGIGACYEERKNKGNKFIRKYFQWIGILCMIIGFILWFLDSFIFYIR